MPDQGSDQGYVYFIAGAVDDGRIKIGYSKDPLRRVREFQDRRVWLAAVPGTREQEQALHHYFSRYRHEQEWFWNDGELAAFVEWLRREPFTAKVCTEEALACSYARDGWLPWMQPEQHREFDNQIVLPFAGFDWTPLPPSSVVADEYYTRTPYIAAARDVMDGIELDPASCRTANDIVRADRYFTINDEGLHLVWRACSIWLNPPFSRARDFATKLVWHYEAGDVGQAIMLLGNRATSTNWFQPLWKYTMGFTNHRIHFDGPDGRGERPDAGHIFVYLGPDPERFASRFAEFGTTVRQLTSGKG